jgi:hypothetical protein
MNNREQEILEQFNSIKPHLKIWGEIVDTSLVNKLLQDMIEEDFGLNWKLYHWGRSGATVTTETFSKVAGRCIADEYDYFEEIGGYDADYWEDANGYYKELCAVAGALNLVNEHVKAVAEYIPEWWAEERSEIERTIDTWGARIARSLERTLPATEYARASLMERCERRSPIEAIRRYREPETQEMVAAASFVLLGLGLDGLAQHGLLPTPYVGEWARLHDDPKTAADPDAATYAERAPSPERAVAETASATVFHMPAPPAGLPTHGFTSQAQRRQKR